MSRPLFEAAARGLAAAAAVPYGLRLRLEELGLDVRTNSAAVADDLAGYFVEFRDTSSADNIQQNTSREDTPPADMHFVLLDGPVTPPPVELAVRPSLPGKRPDKERQADLPGPDGRPAGRIARKQATGMLFAFGGGWNLAVGPCAANRNQIVNFLCERYLARRVAGGWALCHAAGVARNGRGLVLCGVAGMGKSTLALHLLARGLDFVSNDRILVSPASPRPGGCGPMLHGIPKQPRLNPGTALGNPELVEFLRAALPADVRRRYAHLSAPELRGIEDKFDADVAACFGPGRFRLSAGLAGVVVLNWSHAAAAGPFCSRRADLSCRPDLLRVLRKPPGVFYLPWRLGGARLTAETFLEALAGVPAWEFTGGADFPSGAAACLDILGRGAA